jgi:fatty-acid peroxygenase
MPPARSRSGAWPASDPGTAGPPEEPAAAARRSPGAGDPGRPVPRVRQFDSTLAWRADPYGFIGRQCREHHSDVVEARLLLEPTLCLSGAAAARLFYDPRRFERAGAAPMWARATVFGEGGVQGLDGEAHLRRKAWFLEVLTPPRVAALARLVGEEWEELGRRWRPGERVSLAAAAQEVLTRSVCHWAGLPLRQGEVGLRTRDLVALYDRAAAGPLQHLVARRARERTERWVAAMIEAVRDDRLREAAGSPLETVAWHRDLDGMELPARVAAVELLSVLGSTVAVSVWIAFAAHALQAHPECVRRIRLGHREYLRAFLDEVRRTYPFFPAIAARVRTDFEWQGWRFQRGRRVLLDVCGSNHDPRVWELPERFRPERFLEGAPGPFDFIPQGGGDVRRHHRCPGEPLALALMRQSVRFLLDRIDYEVPARSMEIDRRRLPALPLDGFSIRIVRGVR